MKEYLLFIDTEGTGWPGNWDAPYSETEKWPHCIQISWLVYTKNGVEVKREDHYIKGNFHIERSSFEIHGITNDLLADKGDELTEVMTLLKGDIDKYDPLIVGHFMELDRQMLNVEFYRSGINSPLTDRPFFCTMIATADNIYNTEKKYLRLGELYVLLFDKQQPGQHNALYDAQSDAECYFELTKRGVITGATIEAQQHKNVEMRTRKLPRFAAIVIILVIIVFVTLIICML